MEQRNWGRKLLLIEGIAPSLFLILIFMDGSPKGLRHMITLQRFRVLTWYNGRGGTGLSDRGWEREKMRRNGQGKL
jgi:hypothetical protein